MNFLGIKMSGIDQLNESDSTQCMNMTSIQTRDLWLTHGSGARDPIVVWPSEWFKVGGIYETKDLDYDQKTRALMGQNGQTKYQMLRSPEIRVLEASGQVQTKHFQLLRE